MSGVSTAHAYQPGASPKNARATDIGRLAIRAKTTVSSVESTAGIDQIATNSHAESRGCAGLSASGFAGEGGSRPRGAHGLRMAWPAEI